jgi:hypothetical protein
MVFFFDLFLETTTPMKTALKATDSSFQSLRVNSAVQRLFAD